MRKRGNMVGKVIDLLDRTFNAVDEVKTVYDQLKSITRYADSGADKKPRTNYSVDPSMEHCNAGMKGAHHPTSDYSSYTVDVDEQSGSKNLLTEVRLAGVSYGNRQEIIAKLHGDDRIYLQREPFNHYDANAIGVYLYSTKQHIGWIPRHIARELAPIMDKGMECRATIQFVSGGQKGSFKGVSINVITPVTIQEKSAEKQKSISKELQGRQKKPKSPSPCIQTKADNPQNPHNMRGYAYDNRDSGEMDDGENDELFANYVQDFEGGNK